MNTKEGGTAPVKAVTTIIDQDHYLYEMFLLEPNENQEKMMAVFYSRKK